MTVQKASYGFIKLLSRTFFYFGADFILRLNFDASVPYSILLTGKTMKSFLERLAGGCCSFRDLGMGETAALSLSKGMRRGQDSPVNKSLKKQAREPWNERKGFMVFA
jgi:hypothetical protein